MVKRGIMGTVHKVSKEYLFGRLSMVSGSQLRFVRDGQQPANSSPTAKLLRAAVRWLYRPTPVA